MAKFKYKAIDKKGNTVYGWDNSVNSDMLKENLFNKGLWLLEYKSAYKNGEGKPLKSLELAEFCRELSSMISAGVSLTHSIEIISELDIKSSIKQSFKNIGTEIRKGNSLSDAMALQGRTFPVMLINMVKAGEESGSVDDSMKRMSIYYEKEHRLNTDVRSAMIYPIMLIFLMIIVMAVIFTFVIPRFTMLFGDIPLPATTRIVISCGNFLKYYGFLVVLGLILAVCIFMLMLSTPKTRIIIDRLILKIPKISNILKILYTARFARTLCSLYTSGISIITALQTSRYTIGNSYIQKSFDETIKRVRSGTSLSFALFDVTGLDKKLIHSVKIGEESGNLDTMLVSLAESYEYEVGVVLKRFTSMLEPIMICIMGSMVAFCIISVLQPIYTLYNSIS